MKIISKLLVLCGISFFCHSALASNCSKLVSTLTVRLPVNITVQRDLGVGQPVTDWVSTNGGPVPIFNCSYTNGEAFNIREYSTVANVMTYSDGGVTYFVHPTTVTGIGVALRARSQGQFGMSSYYNFPLGTPWNTTSGYAGNINALMEVDAILVKIGDVISGDATDTVVGGIKSGPQGSSAIYSDIPVVVSATKITKIACEVKKSNIEVPLDNVFANDFTAVDSVAKPKVFNVGLVCDAGARVNAKLTGTQNSHSSADGVLELTGAGGDDVAEGVGIQILYGSSTMKLNKNIVLKTSAGGEESLPFTAQYYQTLANVKAGTANATATLELTYQ